MKFTQEIITAIKDFIINNIEDYPNNITSRVIEHFDISRQTVSKYIKELIDEGIVKKNGNGRYPNYQLSKKEISFIKSLKEDLEEDTIWRQEASGFLKNVPSNIKSICQYGFTEMVNNAIDHSEGDSLFVNILLDYKKIIISIKDDGIGIFEKIKRDMNLDDPKHSILELAKGKFTSDPDNHTGEGIFFTSRVFDSFVIISNELSFIAHKSSDMLFEEKKIYDGTWVYMAINRDSQKELISVFDEYADPDKIPGFHKTIIPVKLMEYEGESLVSRSQAKRLINRFDHFLEVILDFEGVTFIGQGFADQVFRIFANNHPEVELFEINTTEEIKKMIAHVRANNKKNNP